MDQHQTDTMFKNMLLAEQAQLSTLKTQHISQLNGQIHAQDTPMLGAAQGMATALKNVCAERDAALQALKAAYSVTREWQAATEAWRDLAQTLRDEIKACPNHEAHAFGQNDTARNQRRNQKEDEARVARDLKPRYPASEKGI